MCAEVTPLDLTKSARDISVTERGQFRSCRRNWELSTLNNWTPRSPQWALSFGTGIHEALEEIYGIIQRAQHDDPEASAIEDYEPYAHASLEKWYKRANQEFAQALGPLFTEEAQNEVWDLLQMGKVMLTNYITFMEEQWEKDPWEIVAIEGRGLTEEAFGFDLKPPYLPEVHPRIVKGRIQCPIVDPDTGEWLPGKPYLSGRLDIIVRRGASGNLWVVDHKTSKSSPSDRGLDFDDQVTGYSYLLWRLTGAIPRGTLFNYLVKQVPKEPRMLASGKLSTAKDQLCTPNAYREAMLEQGIMTPSGVILDDKYEACYEALLAKGWDPYFQRHEPMRNQHEMDEFEAMLVEEYRDMYEVYLGERVAYPNKDKMHCGWCSVNRICQAMSDGSDVQSIIEGSYMQAPDRKSER